MLNMDSLQSIKVEVLSVINMKESPQNYLIETTGDYDINNDAFDVYKFYDEDKENLKYHVEYCKGNFVLMQYNVAWDYEMESGKFPGLSI